MTAEIGVLNKIGVALAADSAVTIGGDSGKVYASSDKLFQLSSVAPIGIMVYGNASFLGMPWETIIKTYRSHLAGKRLPSVDAYAKDFFAYVTPSSPMLPREAEDAETEALIGGFFTHLRNRMASALDRQAEQQDGLDEPAVTAACASVVTQRLSEVRKHAALFPDHDTIRSTLIPKLASRITHVREVVFGSLPLSPETVGEMDEYIYEALLRHVFGPFKAGVVVAGFGEDQFLPALVNYECEGRLDGRVRLHQVGASAITLESDAALIAFAQRETVTTFLEGIDVGLADFMRTSTLTLFQGAFEAALALVAARDQAIATEVEALLRPQLTAKIRELLDAWENQCKAFWQPVIGIVSSLPKDELAAMAEALVNLTKFRRRVTPERETVGGPIDVAIITKGDGFVWVKRKHYFEPALNPRIMARYNLEAQP